MPSAPDLEHNHVFHVRERQSSLRQSDLFFYLFFNGTYQMRIYRGAIRSLGESDTF